MEDFLLLVGVGGTNMRNITRIMYDATCSQFFSRLLANLHHYKISVGAVLPGMDASDGAAAGAAAGAFSGGVGGLRGRRGRRFG